MDVILLSDVDHVGLRGEVVSVARGYARNFLLPRRLAEEATAARVAELRKREAGRARHEAKTADQAREIAGALAKVVLRFEVKAGPTGSLFGSVTPTNIADEIWEHEQDPRRPAQDRHRHDQADRPLRRADRRLRRRQRRRCRRSSCPRAASCPPTRSSRRWRPRRPRPAASPPGCRPRRSRPPSRSPSRSPSRPPSRDRGRAGRGGARLARRRRGRSRRRALLARHPLPARHERRPQGAVRRSTGPPVPVDSRRNFPLRAEEPSTDAPSGTACNDERFACK